MERVNYSIKADKTLVELRCNDEQIISKVQEYIDILLKAKAYESIQSIPTKTTFIDTEEA